MIIFLFENINAFLRLLLIEKDRVDRRAGAAHGSAQRLAGDHLAFDLIDCGQLHHLLKLVVQAGGESADIAAVEPLDQLVGIEEAFRLTRRR